MLHTPGRSIRSIHTMLIPVRPLFMTLTRTKLQASSSVTVVRGGHAIPWSLKRQSHKWNPWSLLPVVHLILLRMTRHEMSTTTTTHKMSMYSLAFQIYANEIIESYISSDHSYRSNFYTFWESNQNLLIVWVTTVTHNNYSLEPLQPKSLSYCRPIKYTCFSTLPVPSSNWA